MPNNNVIFLIEGTPLNGSTFEEIKNTYILKILKTFEEVSSNEELSDAVARGNNYTVIVYGNLRTETNIELCNVIGPFTQSKPLLSVMNTNIEFENCASELNETNIIEGLLRSFYQFCAWRLTENNETQKHCILICTNETNFMLSPNCIRPFIDTNGLANIYQKDHINFSVISAKNYFVSYELEKIFHWNENAVKNKAIDGSDHLVLLNGFTFEMEEGQVADTSNNESERLEQIMESFEKFGNGNIEFYELNVEIPFEICICNGNKTFHLHRNWPDRLQITFITDVKNFPDELVHIKIIRIFYQTRFTKLSPTLKELIEYINSQYIGCVFLKSYDCHNYFKKLMVLQYVPKTDFFVGVIPGNQSRWTNRISNILKSPTAKIINGIVKDMQIVQPVIPGND